MKKVLFICLLVLFVSCDSFNTKKVEVLEFRYKKHLYLRFHSSSYYGVTFLHSPDCKCYEKNESGT